MTKETKTAALSRRKLLGRIGVLAAAGYTVPALTTLSMAQAGSGASGGGRSEGASGGAATPAPNANAVAAVCGPENLNDPAYLQCLVANGF